MENNGNEIPNVTGHTVGAILIQFLALMFFFLALVAFMNNSIVGAIILFVIGVAWEVVFVKLIRKVIYWKKHSAPDVVKSPEEFYEPIYKNDGEGFDFSRRIYCKQTGKDPKHLTKEDENIIWDYTCDDFTYLMVWVMEKDLYQPCEDAEDDEAEEAIECAVKIKARNMLPSDYLMDNAGYFMEDEVKKKARDFVKYYYEGPYRDELRKFAKDKLGAELYGFPFRWEDYDAFKINIDKAFEDYGGADND